MKIVYKNASNQQTWQLIEHDKYGLKYFQNPVLSSFDEIQHCFSTRFGGVSDGFRSSMNLSFHNGDDEALVTENYKRIAEVMKTTTDHLVLSNQTHTNNIRVVSEKDAGNGILYPNRFNDVDGLVTNKKGLVLATSYADCVPIYFYDYNQKVIGLAHAGWRGTISEISKNMVLIMREQFSSDCKNIICVIGPSICQECYEIGQDVADYFKKLNSSQYLIELYASDSLSGFGSKKRGVLIEGKVNGKYQLDLWAANYIFLREAGVPSKNISLPGICTCENPALLFSHRASKGKRGNLNAFIMLKEDENGNNTGL